MLIDLSDENLPTNIARLNQEIEAKYSLSHQSADYPRGGRVGEIGTTLPQYLASTGETKVGINSLALENWEIQIHSYNTSEAANIGIFNKLFGGEGKSQKFGIIHEAKRYSHLVLDDGQQVEVGCAVRLAVAVKNYDTKLELTIPNIAASAQISSADARVCISVVGYAGPLGDHFPAPNKFDVETCIDYLHSFSEIQRTIFSHSNLSHIKPTLLTLQRNDTKGT